MNSVLPITILLISVATMGCGGGNPVSTQDRDAIEALATYEPKYELDEAGRVVDLTLEGRDVLPEALDAVGRLHQLRRLSLYAASLTDSSLAKLSELKWLESVGLGGTSVTDEGLKHLGKLRRLRFLWLPRNRGISQEQVGKLKTASPSLQVYWQ